MMLMYGFEKPSPEIMQAWNDWFGSLGDRMVARGHFPRGHEYSKAGDCALPMAIDSITGYQIVRAGDLEAAILMARTNPFISAIRVYEIMGA
jgi:hypothetical protein